jgi:hypothetical protein
VQIDVLDLSAVSGKHLCAIKGSLGIPLASLTMFRPLGAVALDGEPLRGPMPEEQVSEYALEGEDPAAALTIAWQATSTSSAVFLRTGAPRTPCPLRRWSRAAPASCRAFTADARLTRERCVPQRCWLSCCLWRPASRATAASPPSRPSSTLTSRSWSSPQVACR